MTGRTSLRVLLALDGTPGCQGALRLATALARDGAAEVEVVTVAEALPGHETGFMPAPVPVEVHRSVAREQLQRVQKQLAAAGGSAGAWRVSLRAGHPARAIARAARSSSSNLVLLGLGRRRPLDRILAGDVAIGVVRLASTTVFAAHADVAGRPARAVAAMDFSPFSRDATAMLLRLLEPGGEVHLVHVVDVKVAGLEEWTKVYREAAVDAMARAAADVEAAGHVRAHAHVLQGDTAREVLRVAGEIDADVLALGSHGHSFMSRILMGSVSEKVMRAAECSVLVAPPRGEAEEARTASAEAARRPRALDGLPGWATDAPEDEPPGDPPSGEAPRP